MDSLTEPLRRMDLPFAKKLCSGKVREIFALGDDLLLVTSDRVSAFDVVLSEGIPGKGKVLTSLSSFWFRMTRDLVDNHLLSCEVEDWDEVPEEYWPLLAGRSMRCKRAQVLPVEWVVRGYLTGSGFKDYQKDQAISGLALPPGLQHAAKLRPAILTPTTKAELGHDEPISFQEVEALVGAQTAASCRDLALALYQRGHDYALKKGFVLADTKFEFGRIGEQILLIDECLTPDSSRYWQRDEVKDGAHPRSFDKQVIRDYLARQDWDKKPPAPRLPLAIQKEAAAQYLKIHEALTGRSLPG